MQSAAILALQLVSAVGLVLPRWAVPLYHSLVLLHHSLFLLAAECPKETGVL